MSRNTCQNIAKNSQLENFICIEYPFKMVYILSSNLTLGFLFKQINKLINIKSCYIFGYQDLTPVYQDLYPGHQVLTYGYQDLAH